MAILKLHSSLIILFVYLLQSPASSKDCKALKFSKNRAYEKCSDLPQLESSIHWTYNAENSFLSLAFVATPPSSNGWISWAYNTQGTKMVESQALIAYKSDGSIIAKQFYLESYASIIPKNLSFKVQTLQAETAGDQMQIYATLVLPPNLTTLNQVWQVGGSVSNGFPVKHDMRDENLHSYGTLNFSSGGTGSISGDSSGNGKKNIHAVLNGLSWGILFPFGAILSGLRTWKSADPAWFYLHVCCQLSAYVLGVAGWGTGLQLGIESEGIQFSVHRYLGMTLFALATLQMFAIFLRPRKDHKYRMHWNMYHYGVGMGIIVLGIVNVFKGLDILEPEKKWITGYVVVLIALIFIAIVMGVFRCLSSRRK